MVCCVMFIVVGNGHSDPSSNRWLGSLHFTERKYLWERYENDYIFLVMGK